MLIAAWTGRQRFYGTAGLQAEEKLQPTTHVEEGEKNREEEEKHSQNEQKNNREVDQVGQI